MKRTRQYTRLGGRKVSTATLFAATALALVEAANVSDSAPLLPSSVEMPFLSVTGPLEDASCDVEQLEQANDSQLHVILTELMATSFFKSFAVDLKQVCHMPLLEVSSKPTLTAVPDAQRPEMSPGGMGQEREKGESRSTKVERRTRRKLCWRFA